MWYNVYWLYLHSEAVVLLPVCRAFLSWSLSFSLTLWSAVSVFLWLPEVKLPTHCIRAFPSWDERLRLENFLCGTEVGNLPQWASGVLENCCCFVVFFFFLFLLLSNTAAMQEEYFYWIYSLKSPDCMTVKRGEIGLLSMKHSRCCKEWQWCPFRTMLSALRL